MGIGRGPRKIRLIRLRRRPGRRNFGGSAASINGSRASSFARPRRGPQRSGFRRPVAPSRRGSAWAPPDRLRDDVVDDAEALSRSGAVRLERFGGLGPFLSLVFPENRRTALRRDHRVDRVLEHEDAVADPQGRGHHRCHPSPVTDDHDRHPERRPSRSGCGRSPRPGRAPRRRCPG